MANWGVASTFCKEELKELSTSESAAMATRIESFIVNVDVNKMKKWIYIVI